MKAQTMTDRERDYQRQVQELTQRIGELCQQVNDRDKFIETAGEDFRRELNARDALIAKIELNTKPEPWTLHQAEFIIGVINDLCQVANVETVEGGE